MSNKKQWAVIGLLALLNLQHINLKEQLGGLRLKIRTIESFMTENLGYKQQEKNSDEQI